MIKILIETLLAQLYQLEMASDDDLNEDFSVKLMEQAAASLQLLDMGDAQKFLEIISDLSKNAADNGYKEYLQEFGENFGITDILA